MVDFNSLPTEKCLKCNSHFLPPLYQCPKEHILCNNCTQESEYMQSISSYSLCCEKKLKSVTKVKLYCGICSCFYLNDKGKRNLKLENLVQSIQHPCIYHGNGCQFRDSYTKIENHIEVCNFIIKNCCWKNCSWNGILLNMKNHLRTDHPVLSANEVKLLRNEWTYSFFSKDDFFLMKTLIDEDVIKFCVFYCGEPDKYVFEIHLGTKTTIYIKIKHVIKLMKNNKTSLFDFENSDIFTVDLNFIEQYVRKPCANCRLKIFFRVDVLEIEEIIKQNEESIPISVVKKVEKSKYSHTYQ